LKHRLTLEGQMGEVPGRWTGETSEKDFDATTNLVGGKERRKKVSSDGCSTGLVFGLIISHLCGEWRKVSPGDAKEPI